MTRRALDKEVRTTPSITISSSGGSGGGGERAYDQRQLIHVIIGEASVTHFRKKSMICEARRGASLNRHPSKVRLPVNIWVDSQVENDDDDTQNLNTIEMLKAFLDGNQSVAFSVLGNKTERYQFIQTTLVKFDYITLPRKNKSIVIQYLMKMMEYSRQQLTRLIKKNTDTGKIKWMPCRCNGFAKTYTDKDIILLAKTDELHDTPCGHAVKKLCERTHLVRGVIILRTASGSIL